MAGIYFNGFDDIDALVIFGGLPYPLELVLSVPPDPCEVLFCFRLSVLFPAEGTELPSVLGANFLF